MVVDFTTQQGQFSFILIEDNWIDNPNSLQVAMGIEVEMLKVKENYYPSQIEVIDFVKDLTEEEWSKVVYTTFYRNFDGTVDRSSIKYKNYNGRPDIRFDKAKISGESLMNNLEVYTENPVSQPENPQDESWIEAWQYCGERTGNWLLIKYK